MKRILLVISAILPLFAYADIIATFNNGNIEDVTVVSVGADEVVYKIGNAQKTIASTEVEGVLYDDGRFVSPPKKTTTVESVETTADDSWAIDDAPSSETTQSTSTNHREKREKKERSNNNSEVGQAFKEAGDAIKDAFTTMFDAMGKKKKDKSSSETISTETDSNQGSSSASDDGW